MAKCWEKVWKKNQKFEKKDEGKECKFWESVKDKKSQNLGGKLREEMSKFWDKDKGVKYEFWGKLKVRSFKKLMEKVRISKVKKMAEFWGKSLKKKVRGHKIREK